MFLHPDLSEQELTNTIFNGESPKNIAEICSSSVNDLVRLATLRSLKEEIQSNPKLQWMCPACFKFAGGDFEAIGWCQKCGIDLNKERANVNVDIHHRQPMSALHFNNNLGTDAGREKGLIMGIRRAGQTQIAKRMQTAKTEQEKNKLKAMFVSLPMQTLTTWDMDDDFLSPGDSAFLRYCLQEAQLRYHSEDYMVTHQLGLKIRKLARKIELSIKFPTERHAMNVVDRAFVELGLADFDVEQPSPDLKPITVSLRAV